MRFSEREGLKPVRQTLQIGDMDGPLRNGLWSVVAETVPEVPEREYHSSWSRRIYRKIWRDFFRRPIDDTPSEGWKARLELRAWYSQTQWFEVYDFLEFLFSQDLAGRNQQFLSDVNLILQREMGGYRFIQGTITPITDEREIASVNSAIETALQKGLTSVQTHLTAALSLLSDRVNPDYRNSIKESISAIEAVARLLSGDDRAELGAALRSLEAKAQIHGALKSAFLSMYGYTSDASGIRHALSDDPKADFADAKFMLVACAAFCHYLIQKATQSGIL